MQEVVFKHTFKEEVYRFAARTAVIISAPWSSLKKPEKDLLEKILNAVGLSTAAVHLVNHTRPDLDALNPKPEKVIVFGGAAKGITLNEVIQTPGMQAVFTKSLSELTDDDECKRNLWLALKALFGR